MNDQSMSSSKKVVISCDVMGGDFGPESILSAAHDVSKSFHDLEFVFVGDKKIIESFLSKNQSLSEISTYIVSEEYISTDETVSKAIRKKNSSLYLAIEQVKKGKADAVISSGHTGALMALAKLILRPLKGVYRPAIAALMPHQHGQSVMLDLGANVACDAEHLMQFALMGDAFAKVVLRKERPKIGLLNVGAEEVKGHDEVKLAADMLRNPQLPIDFYGFIEGNDIARGTVDVIVTDGFTGNIALKTAEGIASLCSDFFKHALMGSRMAKIGAWFAAPSIKKTLKQIDPRKYNGAMFLGLSGVAVKSHGGADKVAHANAISLAYHLVKHQINERIIEELSANK